MAEDKKSWAVKDEAIFAELATLLELTPDEIKALNALHGTAQGMSEEMASSFYTRLMAQDNTKEYFAGVDLGRMHKATGKWFADLFCGNYDTAYVRERLNIGVIHVRIGLPVRYPLAMIDLISAYGEKVTAGNAVAQSGFRKVLALDIAVFNQAYEDNQLKHLAELVGGERLARRLLTGAM